MSTQPTAKAVTGKTAQEKEAAEKHAIHDFTAKLRQPAVFPQVAAYVRWRRALAEARANGQPDPEPPQQSPISINLDLTVACNYRCTHCIDWDVLNTKHRLEEDDLRESILLMRERRWTKRSPIILTRSII